MARRSSLFVVLLSCLAACASVVGEVPAPHRPLKAIAARTTAPGTVEVESGVTLDPQDTLATPTLVKYGSGTSTEVFVGWTPFLDIDRADINQRTRVNDTGTGDVVVGFKWRTETQERNDFSLAFMPRVKIPTATDALGTGEVDTHLAFIGSRDRINSTNTILYQLNLLGDRDSSEPKWGYEFAIATAQKASDRLWAFGEFTGSFVPEDDDERVFFTLGGSTAPRADTVLDLSASAGLTPESADFVLRFGITRNLGRVGPR